MDLQVRFSLLKHVNQTLMTSLSLLDLRDASSPWTIAYQLRQIGHCIFFDIKQMLIEAAIEATSIPSDGMNSSTTHWIVYKH